MQIIMTIVDVVSGNYFRCWFKLQNIYSPSEQKRGSQTDRHSLHSLILCFFNFSPLTDLLLALFIFMQFLSHILLSFTHT